jgi:hypothetical protein
MSTHDGTVDEVLFKVGICTQDCKDVVPGILGGLAGKTQIGADPPPKLRWKIAPRAASVRYFRPCFN